MLRTSTLRVNDVAVDLSLKDITLGADEVRLEYVGQLPHANAQAAIEVGAAMFADVYADQVNHVNIRRLGVMRTLVSNGSEAGLPQTLVPVEN